MAPFIVYSLPRSRSFWLSKFLSFSPWHCAHEELAHIRSIDDIKSWLNTDFTGTCETGAAPFWRTIQRLAPEARVVVIRRPVEDVIRSLAALGFDPAVQEKPMRYLDGKLDQIEQRVPNVLSVHYEALNYPENRKKVFEHCLQMPLDPAWDAAWANTNQQSDVFHHVNYLRAHRPQLEKLRAQIRTIELHELSRKQVVREPDEITTRVEHFDTFAEFMQKGGSDLVELHWAKVGENPAHAHDMNEPLFDTLLERGALQVTTARSNGKLYGYLVTIVGPHLEFAGKTLAVHTSYYASDEFKGLGKLLQSTAEDALRERGVDEIQARAGVRGDGPRMAAVYRRAGWEPYGQLFRRSLKD